VASLWNVPRLQIVEQRAATTTITKHCKYNNRENSLYKNKEKNNNIGVNDMLNFSCIMLAHYCAYA